jgi:hypothetical protein
MKGINYGRFISVYQSQDGGYVLQQEEMRVGVDLILPSLHSSAFCLALISYLSIYLSYLLVYLIEHYHFLTITITTCRDKFY